MEGSVFTADTTRREGPAITARRAFIKIQQRTLLTEGFANVSKSVKNFWGLCYWALFFRPDEPLDSHSDLTFSPCLVFVFFVVWRRFRLLVDYVDLFTV